MDFLSSEGIKTYNRLFLRAAERIDTFAKRCILTTSATSPVKFLCDETGRIDIRFMDAEVEATPRMVNCGKNGFIPELTFYATNGVHARWQP